MKRILTIVSALSLLVASGAMAEDYGWSISLSSTSPSANTGTHPVGAPFSLYLWLDCTLADGVSAMEADLSTAMIFTGYTPIHPSNNFGAGNALQLGVGGCPFGSTLIGSLGMIAFTPGQSACLVPSAANGLNVSVDCTPQANQWPNAIVGYADAGLTPCITGDCTPTAIESGTWGSIKSLYR
jgi:hypothetical protein